MNWLVFFAGIFIGMLLTIFVEYFALSLVKREVEEHTPSQRIH